MSMRMKRLLLPSVLLVVLAVLAVSEAVAGTGTGTPSRAAGRRPRDLASAAIDGHRFHELNMVGVANAAGLRVVSARAREFELLDAAGARYTIQVATVGSTTMPVGAPDKIPTYRLTYTGPRQPTPQPVCASQPNEAILFTGDRYDARAKTVVAIGARTAGWINIACLGTPLADLYLARHTEVSQQAATTAAERQAMLKMLTYCRRPVAMRSAVVAGRPSVRRARRLDGGAKPSGVSR